MEWGPDRIKWSIIVKNIEAGGLKMVNLSEFIKAIKISWFQRVIQRLWKYRMKFSVKNRF